MTEYIKRLQNLENKQLIDVVKNYRQYGYDDEMRKIALSILKERGVSKEHLQLTGNLENKTYDYAIDLYKSFSSNSKIAFLLYILILLNNILTPLITSSSELFALLGRIGNWILFISYFIFLAKSFLNQEHFYKIINKNSGTENALVYLFLGMPFYILAYFYFKSQMKEKMNEIT